jgi:hypothetical protein
MAVLGKISTGIFEMIREITVIYLRTIVIVRRQLSTVTLVSI